MLLLCLQQESPNITTVKGAPFFSLDFMKAPGDLVQCSLNITIKKYNYNNALYLFFK